MWLSWNRGLLLVASIVGLGTRAHAQDRVFAGTATNRGYPAAPSSPLTGTLHLSLPQDPEGVGYLDIGSPLGGSGAARVHPWADTLLLVTISISGDTILWLGQVSASRVEGPYRIIGGPYKGQVGDWFVEQSSGPPLPLWSLALRPFPDSVDLAAGFSADWSPAAVSATATPPQSAHFLEYVGILVLLGFGFRLLSVVAAIPFVLLMTAIARIEPGESQAHSLVANQVF